MNVDTQWLQSLIDDLNYDTLIEEPWSVDFINQDGNQKSMGNARKRMRDGIWVVALDREKGEFPIIRSQLESAQQILKVFRCGQVEVIAPENSTS